MWNKAMQSDPWTDWTRQKLLFGKKYKINKDLTATTPGMESQRNHLLSQKKKEKPGENIKKKKKKTK